MKKNFIFLFSKYLAPVAFAVILTGATGCSKVEYDINAKNITDIPSDVPVSDENNHSYDDMKDSVVDDDSDISDDYVSQIIALGQKCGDNIYWEFSPDGTLRIVGEGDMYGWSEKDAEAPWEKYPVKTVIIDNGVTSIGENAFYACFELTDVIIPNSVTVLKNSAFSRCRSLTHINIPDSVTSIEGSAFYYCEKLKSITIPNSVPSIEENTFAFCSDLTDVSLPDSITSIGDEAFSRCSSLEKLTLPNSVKTIGESAFYSCKNLKEITLPSSVEYFEGFAFFYCDKLTIRCPSGSYAEKRAKECGINIQYID